MSEVCKPCPHFPGYHNGMQYSDVTCPLCRSESRIAALEARLAEAETHRDKNRETAISSQQRVNQLEARVRELEAALLDLYSGTAEYVYLNHLGDPHNTTPMRNAAKALGAPALEAYDRLRALTALKTFDEPKRYRTVEEHIKIVEEMHEATTGRNRCRVCGKDDCPRDHGP